MNHNYYVIAYLNEYHKKGDIVSLQTVANKINPLKLELIRAHFTKLVLLGHLEKTKIGFYKRVSDKVTKEENPDLIWVESQHGYKIGMQKERI